MFLWWKTLDPAPAPSLYTSNFDKKCKFALVDGAWGPLRRGARLEAIGQIGLKPALTVSTHIQHQKVLLLCVIQWWENKFYSIQTHVWVYSINTCLVLSASVCMIECSAFVFFRLTVFSTLACMRMLGTTVVL